MNAPNSDAFVFFGVTGDLAFKKIFPSLQAMIKRGHLNACLGHLRSDSETRLVIVSSIPQMTTPL
jgi:glucose-6-phosphate 1-dehydrogenase